jgi:glycerol kinase
MAAQRSSFLLWERESGNCVTPLISWEDRRCHDWCRQHEAKLSAMLSSTGLQLTPHYPAPKLAFIMEQDRGIKSQIDNGKLMFGQIDSYCLWRWSRMHQVDLSMAARTLLMNIKSGQWSDELLTYFGIQESILPLVVSSCSRKIHLDPGGMLTASVADQSAAMISTLGLGYEGTLVNLGTGGFVLKFLGQEISTVPGYLTGPVCSLSDGTVLDGIEGTINGIGALLDTIG